SETRLIKKAHQRPSADAYATTMFLPLLLAPSLKRNFVQTSHVGGVMALRGVNVVPTGRG
ncbi:hypothetical protein, partial [Celeribacter baekdonensis]|uniref:hypothetical protein n=1 Tax=Celeribacter baekdonensis TaxID=875171 RepID=UPI0030DDCC2A